VRVGTGLVTDPITGVTDIEPEFFLIPLGGNSGIVYSPLTGRACRVDTGRPIAAQVARAGLWGTDIPVVSPFRQPPAALLPDKVTLFPTNRCGQRCRYCYAQAGLQPVLDMPLGIARGAIDFMIRATVARGAESWILAFHGGGEPLLRFDWLRDVVTYAESASRKAGVCVKPISSTGGLISRRCARWVAAHFAHVAVSFDVLAEVQDSLRASAGGRASWDHVHAVLSEFDRQGLPYFIRTTVTTANIHRLVETAETIAARYRSRLWHVEPMMLDGDLASKVPDLLPDMDIFAERFLAAHRRCAELNITLQYSGTMLDALSSTFHCGVGRDNFAITPDGYVTTCLDVLSKDHPNAGRFVYGQVFEDGHVDIDHAKRAVLHELDVRNVPWCTGCFLKYHCSGDCVVRAGRDPFADRDNDRCRTNRVIAAQLLDRTITDDTARGGGWGDVRAVQSGSTTPEGPG
jgi:uncharacterized protein